MWKPLSTRFRCRWQKSESSKMYIDQWLSLKANAAKWQPLSSLLIEFHGQTMETNIPWKRWLTSFFIASRLIESVSSPDAMRSSALALLGVPWLSARKPAPGRPRWNFKSARSWVERTSWLRRSLIAFYSFFMFTFLSQFSLGHFFPISRATRKTPLKAVFWFHSIVCFAGYSMC